MNLDSNLFFTETGICMPDVIHALFSNFNLCLETFFNGGYLSKIKLISFRKL